MAQWQCPMESMVSETMEKLEFFKGKKVLVTGHTGFKGSWLSYMLTMAGAEVIGYALEPPTDPSLFQISGLEKEIISICGMECALRDAKEAITEEKRWRR